MLAQGNILCSMYSSLEMNNVFILSSLTFCVQLQNFYIIIHSVTLYWFALLILLCLMFETIFELIVYKIILE